MIRSTIPRSRPLGFSLLEVLIAVVVLATGLLALAALQGSLTRSSAEAKVRGRIAATLTARLDELRSTGYDSFVIGTTTTTSTTDACNDGDTTDWVDCAREQAALGSLTVTQTVAEWAGDTTFTQAAPADPDEAQFKRVVIAANWTDATGAAHDLAVTSDVSSLSLTTNLLPPPDDATSGGKTPLVRTISPATAGVIPIALGTGESTAASNPTPELVGQGQNKEIVGTRFNVLNYTPPSGNAVQITKRIENELIKCKCKYGAGGTNLPVIYRTAQWPAIWTGERYEVYTPSAVSPAPGQAFSSGPKVGVEQSALCQECCRDHHDTSVTGVAKFDPERFYASGGTSKYDLNGAGTLVVVPDTSSAEYVNACRIIRVDGFWRTASDMYSRQFGLLETETVAGAKAKTGLPTTASTNAYTTFVKNYLKQYNGTVGTAPANAQTMFDNTPGMNEPALVTISTPSNSDYRYLHGRGLYVDYLEQKARAKLVSVLGDTGAGGKCAQTPTATPLEDCVLPYLPFTSANLTEIAKWVASDINVLSVNSGGRLALNPSQPSGSRTLGVAAGTSNNTSTVRTSSSGVAVNTVFTTLGGVDPADHSAEASDLQAFDVGGVSSTGDQFYVQILGGGSSPFAFYVIGTDTGECLKPATGDRRCSTNSDLPLPGSVRIGNYWLEGTTLRSTTATCTNPQGNLVSATATIDVPTFRNYEVSSASIGGTSALGSAPYSVANDGKETETTTINFGSIDDNDIVMLTLSEQTGSPTYASVTSCTTNGSGNQINAVVWNKPWKLP